jgi:hypothetical protein
MTEAQPTSGIIFLKTPAATTTTPADAESSWGAMASTTDQNFALINAWTMNRLWPSAWSSRLTTQFNPPTQVDWTEVGATWAPVTVPIPQGCRGLWIITSALLETNPTKTNYLAVGIKMTGTGFTGTYAPETMEVSATGARLGASRWLTLPYGDIVVGQSCVFTPVYRQTGTAVPINAHVFDAELFVVALV